MTIKDQIGLGLPVGKARRSHLHSKRPSVAGLAVGTLMSVCMVGTAGPAFGQDATRLGLCSLSAGAVTALRNDVADDETGLDVDPADVEVAFVVVYSLNDDNNGQPLAVGTTGPILCTNPAVAGSFPPSPTFADDPIPPDPEDTVDIFDSAEAFLLRYEESGSGEPETRFCHTTNANVDCYLLGPTPE